MNILLYSANKKMILDNCVERKLSLIFKSLTAVSQNEIENLTQSCLLLLPLCKHCSSGKY